MLAQPEETLNVALVWLVPRVRLIGENINSGHLTNHLEDPRGTLTTLVCGHGAHNNLLPNEVKDTKSFFPRCHSHKNFLGYIGDVSVLAIKRKLSSMKLGATEILLTKTKNLGKALIGDGEGLAL
jgi:hypothetical protein